MNVSKVAAFAQLLERDQRAKLSPTLLAFPEPHYRSAVHVGPKYTRVDFGGSGKYMVVNATGEIFGIKGYGVIHRGHAYGTLDTIHEYDWSDYVAARKEGA